MTTSAPRIVTLADRPELAEAAMDVLGSRWPVFMLAGHPGHDVDLPELLTVAAPRHQVLLLHGEELLGVGLSVPLGWDRTVEGLPGGWDAAVTASAALLASGQRPNVVSALSVTLAPQASGQGLASVVIRAMKAAAIDA